MVINDISQAGIIVDNEDHEYYTTMEERLLEEIKDISSDALIYSIEHELCESTSEAFLKYPINNFGQVNNCLKLDYQPPQCQMHLQNARIFVIKNYWDIPSHHKLRSNEIRLFEQTYTYHECWIQWLRDELLRVAGCFISDIKVSAHITDSDVQIFEKISDKTIKKIDDIISHLSSYNTSNSEYGNNLDHIFSELRDKSESYCLILDVDSRYEDDGTDNRQTRLVVSTNNYWLKTCNIREFFSLGEHALNKLANERAYEKERNELESKLNNDNLLDD